MAEAIVASILFPLMLWFTGSSLIDYYFKQKLQLIRLLQKGNTNASGSTSI